MRTCSVMSQKPFPSGIWLTEVMGFLEIHLCEPPLINSLTYLVSNHLNYHLLWAKFCAYPPGLKQMKLGKVILGKKIPSAV